MEKRETDAYVGDQVHQLLWRKRIGHRQVYEAMGLSRWSLHKKLRGTTGWSLDELMTVAEVLDVAPSELLPPARAGLQPKGYGSAGVGGLEPEHKDGPPPGATHSSAIDATTATGTVVTGE